MSTLTESILPFFTQHIGIIKEHQIGTSEDNYAKPEIKQTMDRLSLWMPTVGKYIATCTNVFIPGIVKKPVDDVPIADITWVVVYNLLVHRPIPIQVREQIGLPILVVTIKIPDERGQLHIVLGTESGIIER